MLPSNVTVELTAEELAEIRRIVPGLRERVVDAGIPNFTRRDHTRSQVQTDIVALTGEYAVAKLFGLGLDACGLMLNGVERDGGRDLILPDGTTAQVKAMEVHTNPHRPFWFALENIYPNEFTADVGIMAYLLCREPGKVKIPGYITRDRFQAEYVLADLGSGKRAAVATCQFDPIEPLLDQAGVTPER
jgi:hypothetical protein